MKHPRNQRPTAVRIYQKLLEEYPDKLQVKERTVTRYVSQKKKEPSASSHDLSQHFSGVLPQSAFSRSGRISIRADTMPWSSGISVIMTTACAKE